MNSSFMEVLRCDSGCHPMMLALRSRCLEPGLYAKHLKVWLQYYKHAQVSYQSYIMSDSRFRVFNLNCTL